MNDRGAEAWSHWQRLFPLLDKDGGLVSLLTRTQMIGAAKQADLSQPLAKDGSATPKIVSPNDTLRHVAAAMADSKLTRYPVLDDDGKFVGIVTIDDLLLARGKERKREFNRTRELRLRWPFSPNNETIENATESVEALDAEEDESPV
jgi:CBS-domain-containing membrane protein